MNEDGMTKAVINEVVALEKEEATKPSTGRVVMVSGGAGFLAGILATIMFKKIAKHFEEKQVEEEASLDDIIDDAEDESEED